MPTKKSKPKQNSAQKRTEVQLATLDERHPFKIGDVLPSDDVLLDLVQVHVQQSVSQSSITQSYLTTKEIADDLGKRIAIEFKTYLAGEQVERPLLGTVLVPKSWWKMFKRDALGKPLRDDEHRTVEVRGNATIEVVYPHLKLPKILPEVKGVLVRVRGQEPNKEYQTVGVK